MSDPIGCRCAHCACDCPWCTYVTDETQDQPDQPLPRLRDPLPEPPPTIWADPAYYRTGPYGE